MNEDQSDKLIRTLNETNELLYKIEQAISRPKNVNDKKMGKLVLFKEQITSNAFFNTLTKEQKEFVLNADLRENEKRFVK